MSTPVFNGNEFIKDDVLIQGILPSKFNTPSNFKASGDLKIYPHVMGSVAGTPYLASAIEVFVEDDTSKINRVVTHSVLISYAVRESHGFFAVTCGNRMAQGKISSFESILKTLVKDTSVKAKDLQSKFGSRPVTSDDQCETFWTTLLAGGSGNGCSHVAKAIEWLEANMPSYKEDLVASYDSMMSKTTSNPFSIDNLVFKIPVLIEGDRGAGKTTDARRIGKKHDVFIEFGGHESVESSDFLGHFIPFTADQWAWKDGPLTAAIRAASKGKKVVFLIDELLRIPQRQLSSLLTALAPTLEQTYELNTERVIKIEDGIAVTEKLSCPVSNLAIIATTNIGSKYAVEEYDPALAERFFIIRAGTTVEKIREVVKSLCETKGFDIKSSLASLTKFYDLMVKAADNGMLVEAPSTRTISQAILLSPSEEDIPQALKDMYLQWVSRDSNGIPVQEQVDTVMEIVNKVFIK